MKSCNEMVNSIIERRDRHVAKQKRKRTMIIRTAASMCCVCLVALFGFGMWQDGIFDATPPTRLDDSINIGEKDYITPNELHANVGNYPNHYSPDGSEKTMISSFNVTGTLSTSYVTPQNGKFGFSIPLREAMNEYEDSVMYRVVVDMFSNEKQLSSDSIQIHDECARLSNIGYVVAYETIFDGESYHYYFTLHATHDELTNFIASENYGYFMFLYDERVG